MTKDTTSRAPRLAVLMAATALAGGATWAAAPTQPAATGTLLSLGDIESRLTAEGLTIRELEIRDRLVEVEAYDADGREIDIVIDRRTGETLSRKFDD